MPIFGKHTLVELSGSCTIDEAVAKHLGWMQGAIRNKQVSFTEYGIPTDELAHLPSQSDFNVAKQLEDMRSEIYDRLEVEYQKCEDNDFSDMTVFDKIESELDECERLIEKAAKYRAELIDELAKKENSVLRIDPTKKADRERYITIKSLEAWEQNKDTVIISSSTIDASSISTSPNIPQEPLSDANTTTPKKPQRIRMRDQGDAIINALVELGYVPNRLPKYVKGLPWVKSEVRSLLENHILFGSDKVFDNAWQRLTKSKQVGEG